jgi:predicted Fe-Mo cluster-binding NifX family protein
MSENEKKILEMLANKSISVDEAHRLLTALGPEGSTPGSTPVAEAAAKAKPKYLRVKVVSRPRHQHHDEGDEEEKEEEEEDEDHGGRAELINVRVPLSLIRAGMKLTSLIPPEAGEKVSEALREKGVDLDVRNMKPEDLEEMIEALSELQVHVVSGKEVVKVCCE